jgi:hypothetical protein
MTNEQAKANNQNKRRAYPQKHRKKLAVLAKKRKAWKQSTGPKTAAGKVTSSRNALKHGARSHEFTELRRLLRLQRDFVKSVIARHRP